MSCQAEGSGSVAAMNPMRALLLELPNEVLQNIASLLPTDRDVINLSLVSKDAWRRVMATDSTIWRARFRHKYDTPQGRSAGELKLEYKIRAIVLPQKIDFKQEEDSEQQHVWLQIIQTMINEALTLPGEIETSKTYETLQRVLSATSFLSHPKRAQPSELFCAVQLCLTPLALDLSISPPCGRSDYEIGAVYSYEDEPNGPFIKHDGLDLTVLLQMRSFWQYHLGQCENTFRGSFSQLLEADKPKLRKAHGAHGRCLSHSWLGYYSCLHPLPDTLEGFSQRESCADLEDHLEQVEVMSLDLKIQPDAFWPDECNRIIPQIEKPDITRVYFEGAQNTLGGNPNAANPLFGFVEPISTPYGGVKGWSRICFVIYERTDEDGGNSLGTEDHWAHGYEAVILPGGNIMLGRWIDLNDATGRGPFIFWDI